MEGLVKSLKSVTDKPIAVGFGISKKERAQEVVKWGADGEFILILVRAIGLTSFFCFKSRLRLPPSR